MQAVITRTNQVSRTFLLAAVLVAGLMLGGVGGYLIHGLPWGTSHPAAAAQVDGLQQFKAGERASAGSPGTDAIAISVARHAAQERAEALPSPTP